MIKIGTVRQIFEVLQTFNSNYGSGDSINRAYQRAVRTIADKHKVTYQTIGDGCRRRLHLDDIDQLYTLLRNWTEGDHKPLLSQLRSSAHPNTHKEILDFFATHSSSSAQIKISTPTGKNEPTEVFSFRIGQKDARMLRALAEVDGLPLAEFIAKLVSDSLGDRLTEFARGIVDEAKK
jgi:hypothetical protein